MNYVIEIAYDGSKFFGFQRLNEEMSVQKALEEALNKKVNKIYIYSTCLEKALQL